MSDETPVESRPLTYRLHALLVARFGTVKIASQGEPFVSRPTVDLRGRPGVEIISAGEYYRIQCPYCGDDKFKLWINHRYGQAKDGRRDNLHLACCYRRDCLRDREKRSRFERLLFGAMGREERARMLVTTPAAPGQHVEPGEARLPGTVIPLAELEASHPAVRYVAGRGFDPATLSATWGVGYCLDAEGAHANCAGRLIAPIRANQKLIGWQARYIGEADWKRTPKYLTMPGLKKSHLLYNYDVAKLSKVVVGVEGITDAWSVGPEAVAFLGKSIAARQRALLATWAGKGGLLALMLDPDARDDALGVMPELGRLFGGRVVMVELPEGTDPGSLSREAIWEAVAASCARANLDLAEFRNSITRN